MPSVNGPSSRPLMSVQASKRVRPCRGESCIWSTSSPDFSPFCSASLPARGNTCCITHYIFVSYFTFLIVLICSTLGFCVNIKCVTNKIIIIIIITWSENHTIVCQRFWLFWILQWITRKNKGVFVERLKWCMFVKCTPIIILFPIYKKKFFYSTVFLRRNVALLHLLTNGSYAVNGCRQNESPKSWYILWSEKNAWL